MLSVQLYCHSGRCQSQCKWQPCKGRVQVPKLFGCGQTHRAEKFAAGKKVCLFLYACGQETERRGLQAVRKQSMNMQDLTTLQEPAVKVNDRREGQLLLHSPLQVICHLAHQPAPCLFFLHIPPSPEASPADGCSMRSHFDGMWFAAGVFPPASH